MANDTTIKPPATVTNTSTALAPRPRQEAGSLVPMGEELDAMMKIANIKIDSGMLPGHIRNAPQYLALMLRARDLRISATCAEDNIYPTTSKDKPGTTWGYSAALMKALAYRIPGFKFGVKESSEQQAVVWSQRADGPVVESTYTIKEAAQAGLTGKSNWLKNPRQMLLSRATTDNLRITAADALMGAEYSVEELQDAGFKPAVEPQRNTINDNIVDVELEEELDRIAEEK